MLSNLNALIYKYNGLLVQSCGNCLHGMYIPSKRNLTIAGFTHYRCMGLTSNDAKKCREAGHNQWQHVIIDKQEV